MHEFSDLSPEQQRQVRRAAEARGMTPRAFLRLVRQSQAEKLAVLDGYHQAGEETLDPYSLAVTTAADDGFSVIAKARR